MNLLKAGQKLSIPDADAVRDRSGRGAPDLQRACRSLRQIPLAPGRGGGRESHRGQGQSAASGTVSRSGDTGAASAASAQDRLRLSNGQDGGQAQADAQGDAKASAGHAMADAQARVTTLQGNVDALNKAVGEQGAAGQAGATGAGGAAGSAGVAGAAGPAAPLALRVLRARRGPLGRLDLAVRQARPVPRDPPPRRWCWRRRIDWRDRRGRRCRIDRSNGAAGSAGTTARQAPRVRVLLRERRASRCCGFRRRRFGCGPGRRFRRFGTRRQERCGPEAVRSAGRRAVLADRQSAGDRHRRAGAARLHHRLGAAPRRRAVAMTTRKPTLTPSRRWTRPR